MLPATACANPPVLIALLAKLVAWLNLSHLEKARVLVMVRTSAITVEHVSAPVIYQARLQAKEHILSPTNVDARKERTD